MDDKIIEIAKKINESGGCLYLVGGAVRDELLGIKNYDEDYCIEGLSEEEFIKLFPEAIIRGKSFKVFDMYGKEFALARTEKKSGKGHKEFEITSNKKITIYEDLKRRDLTINSIAKNVLNNEIIDPFDGRGDLKKKIIKATSESFKEDPLRVYRAARFACKLNFEIENNTLCLMNSLKGELEELSAERVFDEMRKALSYDKPSIFFDMLKKADVLDIHFKEIYKLIGALQPEKYHPEGDSYNHSMLALDASARMTDDVKIRFAVLVHDLGKGVTPKELYPHHYEHDSKGVAEVDHLGNRLKMPNDWIDCGKVSAKEHMKGGIFFEMTPSKQVDFIERVYKSKLGLKGLEIVVECDRNCRGNMKDRVEFAKIGEEIMTEINGDLIKEKFGIDEGVQMKEILHQERIKLIKTKI
ncbi:MAG: HD domain-containing protein [Clostridia bacterium]|nr:HD domain-containing protein [Clostridia bacterium]